MASFHQVQNATWAYVPLQLLSFVDLWNFICLVGIYSMNLHLCVTYGWWRHGSAKASGAVATSDSYENVWLEDEDHTGGLAWLRFMNAVVDAMLHFLEDW